MKSAPHLTRDFRKRPETRFPRKKGIRTRLRSLFPEKFSAKMSVKRSAKFLLKRAVRVCALSWELCHSNGFYLMIAWYQSPFGLSLLLYRKQGGYVFLYRQISYVILLDQSSMFFNGKTCAPQNTLWCAPWWQQTSNENPTRNRYILPVKQHP